MDEIEVVVAHKERTTLRVGDVFLKIDAVPGRLDAEVEAMALAPVPTAPVLWHKPQVLAIGALPGKALGRLGEPSPASKAAWAATGAAVRRLHEAPLPPRPGRDVSDLPRQIDEECAWLASSGLVSPDVVARNREIAQAVLRPWKPVFVHGDLQITHVFTDNDEVTGILDWSEGAQGDAHHDLAILTLGHPERLDDLLAGYGTDVDREVIHAWWSTRSLLATRWLAEHGFDPAAPGCEIDVLKAAM
ncbi:aminoglycoside phosphotransferase [Actinorhabdospora filicis]|uniref:Aminoglycoside phosphotransferase n=1 Tax=Actinorhabdospora filicis TaxID=1785913 RepID=A0A9W6SLB4_9ACTN|nr:phosphotransferase [Actinorhabdospora filicis]GLZ78015.1 aminoglycoside phosphotransferase [Actinorhabdospora filicis]